MQEVLLALDRLKTDLKQFTADEVDRLFKSQEVRFEQIENHLANLNGKVAEHEKRFAVQDGIQIGKQQMRRRGGYKDDSGEIYLDSLHRTHPEITAKLTVKNLIKIIIVVALIANGKWDWIANIFQ